MTTTTKDASLWADLGSASLRALFVTALYALLGPVAGLFFGSDD